MEQQAKVSPDGKRSALPMMDIRKIEGLANTVPGFKVGIFVKGVGLDVLNETTIPGAWKTKIHNFCLLLVL